MSNSLTRVDTTHRYKFIPYPIHVNAIAVLIELILLISAGASLCASCGRFILGPAAILGGPERRTRGTKARCSSRMHHHKRSSMLVARPWETLVSVVAIKLIAQITRLIHPDKEDRLFARLWPVRFISLQFGLYIIRQRYAFRMTKRGFFDPVMKTANAS